MKMNEGSIQSGEIKIKQNFKKYLMDASIRTKYVKADE